MKKKKEISPQDIAESKILSLLKTACHPLRAKSFMTDLNIPFHAKKYLVNALHDLQAQGKLLRLPGGFWGLPGNIQCVTGIFQTLPSGAGRVKITDQQSGSSREIHISPFHTGGAWNNDLVRVRLTPESGGNKGKVLEILARPLQELPAVLEKRNKHNLVFKSIGGKIPNRFLIREHTNHNIQLDNGELAIIKPVRRLEGNPHSGELWEGRFIESIGSPYKVSTQEKIVKVLQQVPGDFPPLSITQAQAIPLLPVESDMAGREDLRKMPFVTIDGADARDFDDAIFVEKDGSDWILRVAIADVSHYVRPDETPDSLDAEALARGNSWYFPRSVEPMLPKTLSNGLCSLKPDEDRLAMLVEIRFSSDGKTKTTRFAPIVMRSAARLIYDDVAAYFAGNAAPTVPERFRPMLDQAHELYELLAKKRREHGSLDFSLPEPAYEFNKNGQLEKMFTARRTDANMLIEEFMIAANEAVAEFLQNRDIPFLYRDHAPPAREKLAQLYSVLKQTALEILPPDPEKDGIPDPCAIQQILAMAQGTSKEYAVNKLCLRAMTQASYQPENLGHFGLGSNAYCHFTSPIRRYADLTVHRSLKAALGLPAAPLPDRKQLEKIATQINKQERKAVECEREMAKRMACLALDGEQGKTMAGTISGVADFGIFVEFNDMPAEGLILLEDLGDDWFQVDKETQTITGTRHKSRWHLGQPLRVKIKSVDLGKQEIRLALEHNPFPGRRKKAGTDNHSGSGVFKRLMRKGKSRNHKKNSKNW